MNYYIGKALPSDLYVLFTRLTGHACSCCNKTLAVGLGEDFQVIEMSHTLVDPYGRPVGLVCGDCNTQYIKFTYKEKTCL